MGIYVQGNDFHFYENPAVWGVTREVEETERRRWYMWFDELEDLARIAIGRNRQTSLQSGMRTSARIVKRFGEMNRKTGMGEDSRIFPPSWDKYESCFVYEVKLFAPIPVELMVHEGEEGRKLVQDFVDLHTGHKIVGQSWEFSQEELLRYYEDPGEVGPDREPKFLFRTQNRRQRQFRIRCQVNMQYGIRNLRKIPSGMKVRLWRNDTKAPLSRRDLNKRLLLCGLSLWTPGAIPKFEGKPIR
jgi:hypothetical protein